MKTFKLIFIALVLLSLSALSQAEKVDHFEGVPSPTLEAALANLTEFNVELEVLLKKDSLSPEDHHKIHELTYTLENAIQKLGSEQQRLAEILEEVHLASETADSKTVKGSGHAYLEGTAPLTHSSAP